MDVRCRLCSVKLRVPDDLAGRKVRCPNCAGTFQIPADPAGADRVLCDGCGGSIAVNEVRREQDGKLLCSACLAGG